MSIASALEQIFVVLRKQTISLETEPTDSTFCPNMPTSVQLPVEDPLSAPSLTNTLSREQAGEKDLDMKFLIA